MTTTASRPGILRDGLLAGVAPADLAARVGTPYFAYDLDLVTSQVAALRAVLPPSFDLAFAVKANPLLALLRHLAALGVGADVASGGELAHALRAGVPAGRIVLTGPGTRDEELEAAVRAGVRVVTVESRGELRRLEAIAATHGRRQPVLLRLNESSARRSEAVRIIGDDGAGKFGMDLDDLRAAAAEAVASAHLELLGIHAFGASNVLDPDVLADHVEATIATAVGVAAEVGVPLRLVDVGGGLGIPYGDEHGLDLAVLGRRLTAIDARLAADPATAGTRVLLEPGRFLVAQAGAYVARVVDRKRVSGADVVVLDGGINHLLRPVLVGQAHRVVSLAGSGAAPGAHEIGPVTVVGPLCTGLDIVGRDVRMAVADVGDLVAVLDVGAYGATESMPFFLSHPLPAEVVLQDGEPAVARPRIEPEAWLRWQVADPWGDA